MSTNVPVRLSADRLRTIRYWYDNIAPACSQDYVRDLLRELGALAKERDSLRALLKRACAFIGDPCNFDIANKNSHDLSIFLAEVERKQAAWLADFDSAMKEQL
jgi:hypothetical protein